MFKRVYFSNLSIKNWCENPRR